MMTHATDEAHNHGKAEAHKTFSWWRPAAVVASSLAGAAALVAFRGCWHGRMSWPIGGQGYSYQVCLKCGAKRLFDEKRFSAYGPFRNDLDDLITWRGSQKTKPDTESHGEANAGPPAI
ncbi:MAG: hypothetical protein WAM89_13390 [Terriglobales bacterium]